MALRHGATSVLLGARKRFSGGTEDVALEWDAVDWRLHEDNVRRLRRRIFKAAQDEDLAKVRSLQKMMLRSWSNTLVSVRQVAQRNTGRETAGIDGKVALTASARMALAVRVHRSIRTWKARSPSGSWAVTDGRTPGCCSPPTSALRWTRETSGRCTSGSARRPGSGTAGRRGSCGPRSSA